MSWDRRESKRQRHDLNLNRTSRHQDDIASKHKARARQVKGEAVFKHEADIDCFILFASSASYLRRTTLVVLFRLLGVIVGIQV